MAIQLSPENQQWLEAFRARHGRAPRILHIGNIANNAYNNAKLLNEAGLDCDVICYDYYHIMGCPEWEDADFSGNYGDQFKPDWVAAGVKDFERPRWFAQGPVRDCIDYLVAKREGRTREAKKLWNKLAALNGTGGVWKGDTQKYVPTWWARLTHYLGRIGRAVRYLAVSRGIASRIAGSCDTGRVATLSRSEVVRLLFAWGLITVALVVRIGGYPFRRLIEANKSRFPDEARFFDARVAELVKAFAAAFPSRKDKLNAIDLEQYRFIICQWRRLFKCYDLIQAYATDTILPLLAGHPYVAFEHGTIRDIPYLQTAVGRMTALSYHLAKHIFITNSDCVESAERLASGRYTIINHPFDEDHGENISGANLLRHELLSDLDCEFLFFHPTRQDWVEGTGYADKGNDVFLHAFGRLRKKGCRVGMVACKWGANVKESDTLLEEYGCRRNVRWVLPMAMKQYERMCKAVDMVADQFKLGAFGGVVFKAMAVGTPILTYLCEDRLSQQYPHCPPVINCRTTEEIIERIESLIKTPAKLARIGTASREWIKKYHSKETMVNAQINQFRCYLSTSTATGRTV